MPMFILDTTILSNFVTAQAAPLPPNSGGKSIRLPQDWGAGGHSGRYRDHSHCLAEQLPLASPLARTTRSISARVRLDALGR